MSNKPNNPSLWSKAKSLAKQKFDVYPSAYANGWAAKWYKSHGGTWRKAAYGMEVPKMEVGGYFPRIMQDGGEPDGGMALQQMSAVVDKLNKLRQFIKPDSDLEPWVSSKLAVMDHYADAVHDYMMYGPEGEEEEEAPMTDNELEEMKNGGIPARYRAKGFTKVGVKRKSTRPGKKWMVLAKKGDQYKIVHGGYTGMKDFTQHHSKKRQKKFWSRMGGKSSSKATDPFSPLYWHKRFGTWEDGGPVEMQHGGYIGMDGEWHPSTGSTNSGNAFYQMGGAQQSQQDQVSQIIQAYSQIADVSPEEIVKKLKSMDSQSQQKALQLMVQAIKQSQNSGVQTPMMAMGGGMPCYGCGGSYAYGGMTGEMGGVVLPALPINPYGLPSYAAGGFTENPYIEDMEEMKGGGALRAFIRNPYVEDMMEMQDGGKPEWLIRAQLKRQGYQGQALEDKLEQMKQGGIYINPKNKGKFTAKAKAAGMGVQGFASKVLSAPEGRYSAATRRQANFARNAAGWKKQDGGMQQFQVGQRYTLTEPEIQALVNAGYQIQYED